MMKISKKMIVFLRVVLSVGLLGLLIGICNPQKMWQTISSASVFLLTISLTIYLMAIFLVAWRWQILLDLKLIKVKLLTLFRYYLIGFFFNNFMPSSIGGDISRIYNVTKHGGSATESFSCVFVERLIGFLAMACLALASLAFLASQFDQAQIVIYITIGLSLAFLLLTWACFNDRLAQIIIKLLEKMPWKILSQTFNKIYQSIHSYKQARAKLCAVFVISILYQAVMGVFVFLTFKATGVEISFWLAFALMQISSMAGIVPITLETAGVREGIFVLALSPLGYQQSGVIAAMLLVRALSILGSSFGGLCLLLGPATIKSYKNQAKSNLIQEVQDESCI